MASDKKLIIVPKPGAVLSLLGASGALADAIKSASVDRGEVHAAGATYTEKTFKSQYQGEWEEPQIPFDEVLADGTTKPSYISAGEIMAVRAAMAMDDLHAFPAKLVNAEDGLSVSQTGSFGLTTGIDWGAEAVAGGITKQTVKDAIALVVKTAKGKPAPYAAQTAIDVHALLGPMPVWDDLAEEENVVDIAFWYYGNTTLVYSIRRVTDNFFYDFATKTFKLLPVTPRAGIPTAAPINKAGYVYSTRLSGQLDDGEYVVTFRDSKADYVVIGIMALFMKNGTQQSTPSQGLEDTPIEEGIPSPQSIYRRTERRVPPVDTEETEGSE